MASYYITNDSNILHIAKTVAVNRSFMAGYCEIGAVLMAYNKEIGESLQQLLT
jgi:hypothetical protein